MDKKYCPYCMNPVKEGEACNYCGLTEGAYVPRDHHLPLGTVLNNRYLVGRVLGEGGFGITYIGCDLNLELKVAIKEYFPIDRVYRFSNTSLQVSNYAHATGKYNSGKEKFLREAHTMARLDKQQSIVSVRDFFEENNTAYIVMEYVEGTTLKEVVKQRGGRIPVGELLDMLEPIFPALTSIHKLGLIHRDISPDNLMLENGKIRLLDFGCAREASVQSETTTIALKQGYAPIEQYQQKGQGPWTDVYALSATIYYCMTGKTPQPAVDRLSEEELVHPRKLGVDLTANQEAALLYGMNMNAKDRFQSMEELYAALYTNEAFTPVSYQPISTPKPDLNQSVPFPPETDDEEETATEAATTSEDATATEEATAPEEGVFQKRFNFLKQKFSLKIKQKRNLLILGSCFLAAAVCIACVVVLLGKSGKSKETIASGTPEGTLFANAAILETFTEEEIQKLMDDDTVSAIRIPKTADDASTVVASTGAITITKPVLVEGNTNISFRDMVTLRGENACLWIQGEVTVDCILQTVDGGEIIVDNSKYVHADTLWLENDEDILWILNGQYSLYGEYPSYRDLIVGGKNNLFRNAVSVSDEDSLRQAASEDQAVIICGDITLRTELHFHAPIMIREDVTVAMQGSGSIIGDGKDFFLWNEGKIQGGLIRINSNTRIINLGEISDGSLVVNGPLVNLGELSVDNVWADSVWTNDSHGSIYNIGTLRFQSETDIAFNTDIVNYGLVAVSFAQDGSFTFCCSSGIENYGEIRVEKGLAVLQSYLRNVTDGRILICDNAVLDNRGVIELSAPDSEWELQCEPQGTLMNAEGAVYYSNGTKGTPEYTPENGWFYIESLHLLYDVSNIDELTDALQDPEVYGVKLTGEIIWNSAEALTLTKDVVIVEGAGL